MSSPVIMIDYLNDLNDEHWDIITKRVPRAQRVEAIGTIEQSLKYVIDKFGPRTWIVSSHCDYSNFDFNFVPSKYDQKYLHIWSSPQTHWGETFLFANAAQFDPWEVVTDLPIKYMTSDIDLQWDLLTWTRTSNQYLNDLCTALGDRKGRVLLQHTDSAVEFNLKNTVLDYKPKLVHLEDSDQCFTFLADATWLKEQQLFEVDLDTLPDQIVIDAAKRTVTLPTEYVSGSDVMRWIDQATARHKSGWIILAHDSVRQVEDYVDKIWNNIYQWGRDDALHAYGQTCAMVLAVNVDNWRDIRQSMTSVYEHPFLITHPVVAVQDPKASVYIKVKDFVQKFDWKPSNWDDMCGPVALMRGDVLLGIAGDEMSIKELELLDDDVWSWPDLRIVEIDAKILKRNLLNVKR